MDILSIIGRKKYLFDRDFEDRFSELKQIVTYSKFLIIGGAGSIGRAVTKLLFSMNPRKLHIIDLSENNLVEIVRSIRSTEGYIDGDFETFCLDFCGEHFEHYLEANQDFDYVLNLSALKHVRSEKDIFTLLRMFETNIFGVKKLHKMLDSNLTKKLFCVSTDKASNPTNLMGASKKLMENYLFSSEKGVPSSTARFANVAFSDGSLLHGFSQRILNWQPISIPSDISRFFMLDREAAHLCLFSALLGTHKEVFIPKQNSELKLQNFQTILERYLKFKNLKPVYLSSENEARDFLNQSKETKSWPCYIFESDTSGEKPFEEFSTKSETTDLTRFKDIGIVKSITSEEFSTFHQFENEYVSFLNKGILEKNTLVKIVEKALPEMAHIEKNKNLNNRM